MFATSILKAAMEGLPDLAHQSIYEFASGSLAYRRHKFQLTLVLEEMVARLFTKITLEEKVVQLTSCLNQLQVLGMIESTTFYYLDTSWDMTTHANHHPLKIFPSTQSAVVFGIIWSTQFVGPEVITVQMDAARQGSLFMTPNYFPPTDEQLALMRHRHHTIIQFHYTITELIIDLFQVMGS